MPFVFDSLLTLEDMCLSCNRFKNSMLGPGAVAEEGSGVRGIYALSNHICIWWQGPFYFRPSRVIVGDVHLANHTETKLCVIHTLLVTNKVSAYKSSPVLRRGALVLWPGVSSRKFSFREGCTARGWTLKKCLPSILWISAHSALLGRCPLPLRAISWAIVQAHLPLPTIHWVFSVFTSLSALQRKTNMLVSSPWHFTGKYWD